MGELFSRKRKLLSLVFVLAISSVVILAFVFSNFSYSARAFEVTSGNCNVSISQCYFLISNPFNTKQVVTHTELTDSNTNSVLENSATSFPLAASTTGNLTIPLPTNVSVGQSIAYTITFSNGEIVSGLLNAR
jgi:hypothetical protein